MCPHFRKLVKERRRRVPSRRDSNRYDKVLQSNLCRVRAAHDLAYAMAKQRSVDMTVVCEPNRNIVIGGAWIKDGRVDVAVLFNN